MRKFTLLAVMALMAMVSTKVYAADFALLVSDNTAGYFDFFYETTKCTAGNLTLGEEEYKRYWRGWEHVLQGAGKSYEKITDAQVNPSYLLNFKVLILSNNFWLDDYQIKVITDWVRRGGKLMATFGTGYQGADQKFKEGGTNGLHELWGDPSTKLNTSDNLGNPDVSVQISSSTGATQGLTVGSVLQYGQLANLLNKRRDANGVFRFNGDLTNYPAILTNKHSKGFVVYYAFAPEFIVSLRHDLAGHCANDDRYPPGWPTDFYPNYYAYLEGEFAQYANYSANLIQLMNASLDFLLGATGGPNGPNKP